MKNEAQESSHPVLYSGLSGIQLNIPRYLYPAPFQDASRLTYYASLFNSIEINSSFYKVPMAATVRKWASVVNADFKFTFKLWKQITHNKDLNFEKADVDTFLSSVDNIGVKAGCLLIQFPPSLGSENIVQLEKLLNCIRGKESPLPWRVAVEFRNKSWYKEEVYELLEFYNAALVKQDIPKSATPFKDLNGDFVYARFHGPTGNYRDSYTEAFLNEYATYIQDWLEAGKSVFVYFNNTMGDAFNNLTTLNKLIQAPDYLQKDFSR